MATYVHLIAAHLVKYPTTYGGTACIFLTKCGTTDVGRSLKITIIIEAAASSGGIGDPLDTKAAASSGG